MGALNFVEYSSAAGGAAHFLQLSIKILYCSSDLLTWSSEDPIYLSSLEQNVVGLVGGTLPLL